MRFGASFLFYGGVRMVDIRNLYSVMVKHCGEQNWPAESKPEIILGAILV